MNVGSVYYQSCLCSDRKRLNNAKQNFRLLVDKYGIIQTNLVDKDLFYMPSRLASETEPDAHYEKLIALINSHKHLNTTREIDIVPLFYRDFPLSNKLRNRSNHVKILKSPVSSAVNTKGNLHGAIDNFLKTNSYTNSDIILCMRSLHQVTSFNKFFAKIKIMLKSDSIIIFEVPDCEIGLKRGSLLLPYEQHFSYFTRESLRHLIQSYGLKILDSCTFSYPNENSLVVIAQKSEERILGQVSNAELISHSKQLISNYCENLTLSISAIKQWVKMRKSQGRKIAAYGIGHYALNLIGLCGLEFNIDIYLDDNPSKISLNLPFSDKIILSGDYLKNLYNTDIVLFTSPNHFETLKSSHESTLYNNGICFFRTDGTDIVKL